MFNQRSVSPTLKRRISVIAATAALISAAAYAATPVELQKQRHEHYEALGDAFKQFPALDLAIYGLMLVLFIIYRPKGILGAALEWRARRHATPAVAPR